MRFLATIALLVPSTVATPDDEGCASYLEHLLTGAPYSHAATLQQIVDHECSCPRNIADEEITGNDAGAAMLVGECLEQLRSGAPEEDAEADPEERGRCRH